MNDSEFYGFRYRIDSQVNKIHFTHEKFSLTQEDKLQELIDSSKELLHNLELFNQLYNYETKMLKPHGFEWTNKNTKDNNWGRKDENR